MPVPPLILGSTSVWRKKVLENAGYAFTCINPDIDEKSIRHADPTMLTLSIAHAKAEALLPRIHTEALLITSDQVVTCNGLVLEKPTSPEEAAMMIALYVKHPAQTVTAVSVTNTKTRERRSSVDLATVYFKPIPEHTLTQLSHDPIVMNSAGALVIEHAVFQLYLDHIEGEEQSVKGMPLELTQALIKNFEFQLVGLR